VDLTVRGDDNRVGGGVYDILWYPGMLTSQGLFSSGPNGPRGVSIALLGAATFGPGCRKLHD
jgi:hypothetical protein